MSAHKYKIAAAVYVLLNEQEKKERKCWVREWIAKRPECGFYAQLLKELQSEDLSAYKNFIRMSHADFDFLLDKVTPLIEKQTTNMRKPISAGERLALTLRFLATGDSYHSLMYLFRIPVCTIARIVPEVCLAIYNVLKDDFLKVPSTEDEWLQVSKDFEDKWNFPNCLGALDGKHINMFAPPNSGSMFYNYKGAHSIVLMAVADANYKILYMNVGSKGRISDGGVFNQCSLSQALEEHTLHIPAARPLTVNGPPVPYVFVADDAFALKNYMMKPYPHRNLNGPERVFNYRLSRARRIIENLFGIMAVRFRVLYKSIHLNEEKTTQIVLAICALHNFLMSRSRNYAMSSDFDQAGVDGDIIPGRWRNEDHTELMSLHRQQQRNATTEAKYVQECFKNYFISTEGEVAWQYARI